MTRRGPRDCRIGGSAEPRPRTPLPGLLLHQDGSTHERCAQ